MLREVAKIKNGTVTGRWPLAEVGLFCECGAPLRVPRAAFFVAGTHEGECDNGHTEPVTFRVAAPPV